MRLEPINAGDYRYAGAALDAALVARQDGLKLWIIRKPGTASYVVCYEVFDGSFPIPACLAWFGVFCETDRFTDPAFRINLGPGVWPLEDES